MKREIKFRAWTGEEMIYFGNGMKHRYDFENGYVFAFSGEEYSGFSHHEMFDDESEFEVMQYTGLKDKNSKEIYDADILRIEWQTASRGGYMQSSDSYCEQEEIVSVCWKDFGFAFLKEDGKYFSLSLRIHKIEIIGNVYENPELLK